ncbi:MAG: beta-glucuronidase [Methylotenera sp.]|nr:beta-glucuronidase [Methylotenera sp.]
MIFFNIAVSTLAFLSVFCGQVALAQSHSTVELTNSTSRKSQNLSGEWRYSVDPYRVGQLGFHGGAPSANALRFADTNIDAALAANPKTFFEQDMEHAPQIKLPGAWNATQTELRYYEGLMWYRRHFDNIATQNERAFLHFDGANYKVSAYVNGALVGSHEGGFTAFSFEITEQLRAGNNQITLGVDCAHNAQSVPPQVTDWDLYCGVTRPINVIYTAQTFINSARIRLLDNGNLGGSVQLNGAQKSNQNIEVSIPELNKKIRTVTNADGYANFEFPRPRGLVKWSPEHPKLYQVEFVTNTDSLKDKVGFRTITTRGTQLLLNDKPIYLRGISMHEEELGTNPSRNMTSAAARELFKHIKNGLNGNFVRLSHYTHSETTLRLADEMGLLVWGEIPVYWTVDFNSPHSLEIAQQTQQEAIARDFNRASIIIWSVGNETPISESRNIFMLKLVAQTRSLDPSRLVSAAIMASRKYENGKATITVDDPLIADLDLLAVNTYNGWYSEDELSALPQIEWVSRADKPMIFSEFGADAKYGVHGDAKNAKFSEEYQALYYQKTLEMADRIPFLVGLSPWILKDFRSPRRQHPIYQEGWNRKGLLSEIGQKKQAYNVLAKFYKVRESKPQD